MILWEYRERIPAAGTQPEPCGAISIWMREELEKRQRIQLRQKLDRLSQVDYDIAKDWLRGTDEPGIFKLTLKGNVQLRPLACYGPASPLKEITFLVGVIKKGGGDVAQNFLDEAVRRREMIRLNLTMRSPYVRANEEKPS